MKDILVNKLKLSSFSQYYIWVLVLGIAFLVSRIYNLTILPIFFDEALHINLALRFESWLESDGTRLLIIWILRSLLPIAHDILWSGRLISVVVGLVAAIGCYLVGQSLFNRRSGAIAFVLYALNPFTLSNDRLIMTDVYLVCWTVLTVWLSIKIVNSPLRWWKSAGLGFILGLTLLSKLNGMVIWILPLLVFGLLGQNQWVQLSKERLVKIVLHGVLIYAIGLIVSAPIWLVLDSGLVMISYHVASNQTITSELLLLWRDQLWQNFVLIVSWLWAYLTPAMAVLSLGAIVFNVKNKPRHGLLLLIWVLMFTLPWIFVFRPFRLPWVSIALVAFPRHILPAFPALFILLGSLLDSVWHWLEQPLGKNRLYAQVLGVVGLILLSWPMLRFDYLLLHDPVSAPFPEADRFQYVESDASGYGISEVVETLRTQVNEKGDIFIAVADPVSRLMAELTFRVRRQYEKSIHILDVRPGVTLSVEDIYAQGQNFSTLPPVYWIADHDNGYNKFSKEILARIHIDQIASFARPGNKSRIYIYSLTPKGSPPATNLQPSNPVNVNFDGKMELRGYDLSSSFGLKGEDLVAVTFYWQALIPMTEDYTVFVHLIGPDGQLIVQHDSQPSLGVLIPTSTWQPNEWIKDRHVLSLPSDFAGDVYNIRVGVYNPQTLEHLPILDGPTSVDDFVELSSVMHTELTHEPRSN